MAPPDLEKKMEDAEKKCHKTVRFFKRTLRLTNPSGRTPGCVAVYYDAWYKKLRKEVSYAIDDIEDLCAGFGQILGPDRVKVWQETKTTCEDEFKERANAWWAVIRPPPGSGSDPAVALPPPGQGGHQSHRAQKALADITVDFEIIVAEGAKLEEEYQKHHWSLATDNDIELAMNKIDDWRRRFEMLQDKRWNIQRKSLNRMNLAANLYMNTPGSELDLAIEKVKYEDESRCLFSINKTETASVKISTFGGEADEDFSKFESVDLVDTDIQEKFADFDASDSKTKLSLMLDFIGELRKKKQILLKSAADEVVERGADGHDDVGDSIADSDEGNESSSDESVDDCDDLSVEEKSEFAGCAIESSSGDDDSGSDDTSDEQYPYEPGGVVGYFALSRDYHNTAGRVVETGLVKSDTAPDVSEITFSYIYERDTVEDLGVDEPEVETEDEIIAMITAMRTDYSLA